MGGKEDKKKAGRQKQPKESIRKRRVDGGRQGSTGGRKERNGRLEEGRKGIANSKPKGTNRVNSPDPKSRLQMQKATRPGKKCVGTCQGLQLFLSNPGLFFFFFLSSR